MPDGGSWAPRPRVDNAMVKALARAFRWQRMFESGGFANFTELAAAEKVSLPYLTGILDLAHLAPTLVESILDGRQPGDLTLRSLRDALQADWESQLASIWHPTCT